MVTVIVPSLSRLITNVEQFLEPGDSRNDRHKMVNLLLKPFGSFHFFPSQPQEKIEGSSPLG